MVEAAWRLILRLTSVRFSLKDLEKDYSKTEDDIKAVQSVGQIIGEVMKQLDDDRCERCHPIINTSFNHALHQLLSKHLRVPVMLSPTAPPSLPPN